MRRRGVCYDAGRAMWGQNWRPEFSLEEARRELQIIPTVRISMARLRTGSLPSWPRYP
jgi:hypothetical protein